MKNDAKKNGTREPHAMESHAKETTSIQKSKCTTDLKEHAALLQEPVSEEELFMEKWLPEKGKCKKHPLCEGVHGHLKGCEIPHTCACAIAYHAQVQARITKLQSASMIEVLFN